VLFKAYTADLSEECVMELCTLKLDWDSDLSEGVLWESMSFEVLPNEAFCFLSQDFLWLFFVFLSFFCSFCHVLFQRKKKKRKKKKKKKNPHQKRENNPCFTFGTT
jgi:hypothetical protein